MAPLVYKFWQYKYHRIGLCWFDGTEFGIFPVEEGGLPHAQIADVEVKEHLNGYELWMSCLSRGIAVLDVITTNVGIEQVNNIKPGLFLQAYPNPFKSSTSISFSLPAGGIISLSIYDINGRKVCDFSDKNYPAGTSSIIWNGDDGHGRSVIPGIYVCRLTEGDQSRSIRIIVL